ncbi:UNVERIFIED_CONTAM: hypothetical protein Slati_3466400 [Sesamum latifolium]|uniref:Reverse transcriptase n=1 Tax=Sesamum latifolium TaxID=2727402 RepID=A0AAW2UHK1_9LAMI
MDRYVRMDQQGIIEKFVGFYQWLLEGERRTKFLDLRYLRPWARHIIIDTEARQLIALVTKDEVKAALFDIAEDKSPGPDGYSMGFYKAAWPIIGEEIISVVLEFYTTCHLLKQVNATLLVLISKVNLRKTYDTVEWDFLIATLHLFEFPLFFIQWIEECVTTPAISVCLNGDGLLLFYKADESSIRLFHRGLQLFASLSGLCANPDKSHLILSKSAQGNRETFLHLLGFQEERLPIRYLGLPLLSSRPTFSDCQPLFIKIDKRIKG